MAPFPESHEVSASRILANYFKTDVYFVKRSSNIKTADIKIGNIYWEIKSPKGDGKRTIQNNLRVADGQSPNLIVDMRRSKMHIRRAEGRIRQFLTEGHTKFKRVLLIKKDEKIVVIK